MSGLKRISYRKPELIERKELAELKKQIESTEAKLPIVIEGKPGCGKSVLLDQLRGHCQSADVIVVPVDFGKLVTEKESVQALFLEICETLERSDTWGKLKGFFGDLRNRVKPQLTTPIGLGAGIDLSSRKPSSYYELLNSFEKALNSLEGKGHRLLITFDDYHKVESDPSLEQVIASLAEMACGLRQTSLCIATRGGLSQKLKGKNIEHLYLELDFFTPEQTREFLTGKFKDMTTAPDFDDFVKLVQEKLKGHPYSLGRLLSFKAAEVNIKGLLQKIESETWEEACDYLDRELLEYLGKKNKELVDLLESCFFLPFLDNDLCSFMLEERRTAHLLTQVHQFHVVEKEDGRYRLHDLFVQFLDNRVAESAKPPLYSRAADYFTKKTYAFMKEKRHPPEEISDIGLHALSFLQKSQRIAEFVDLLNQLAGTLYLIGKVETSLNLLKDARSYNPSNPVTLHNLGITYELLGEYKEAVNLYEQSLKLEEELGAKSEMAGTLHQMGMIKHDQGDYKEALKLYEESLKLKEELGNKGGIAYTLHQMGMIKQHQGDYEEAIKLYEQSLKLEEELGDKRGIAATLHQMGNIRYLQGDDKEAVKLYEQSLELEEELGDKRGIASTLHQLGIIKHYQGDSKEAVNLYEESLKLEEELGNKEGIAHTLHQMGMIRHDQGDYEGAVKLYEQSLELEEELGDKAGIAATLHQLGMMKQRQRDSKQAVKLYEQSLKLKKELGDKEGIAATLHQMGRVDEEKGNYLKARERYSAALKIFQELGSPYEKVAQRSLQRIEKKLKEEAHE